MIDLRLDGFFPALRVPIESAPAVTIGFSYLLVAIFTLTLKQSWAVTHTRQILCAASAYWFYRHGFHYDAPTRSVESGLAIISVYGIFRNVETGFGYSIEPIPRWIKNGKVQKLPETFVWRVIWSLDLLFSMRGTSYLPNTHWDFAPSALTDNKHKKGRIAFMRDQLVSLMGQFLLMDLFDTTTKARSWPTMPFNSHPVTTLTLHYQLYYATVVCMMTALQISIPYTAVSIGAVALGSQPESWPPMFDHPFQAVSLQDFWTHRWHASFRRIFLMVSAAAVHASKQFVTNRRSRQAFRGICIFFLSCTMHLALMYRIRPLSLPEDAISFIDREIFLFFLLQPVGMLLEVMLVRPFALGCCGSNTHRAVWFTRAWAWIWLLWTGRYWSDVWVKHGLWGPEERVVGYSLFRGLLYGEWVQ